MRIKPTEDMLAGQLARRDLATWGMYTAIKHNPQHKKELWALLTDEQRDEIRTLRRIG
jgi:hypothetical protein